MVTGVLDLSTNVPKKTSAQTTVQTSSLHIVDALRPRNENKPTPTQRQIVKEISRTRRQ